MTGRTPEGEPMRRATITGWGKCVPPAVLTNAVYFKGMWAVPFNAKATRNGPFTTASGRAWP